MASANCFLHVQGTDRVEGYLERVRNDGTRAVIVEHGLKFVAMTPEELRVLFVNAGGSEETTFAQLLEWSPPTASFPTFTDDDALASACPPIFVDTSAFSAADGDSDSFGSSAGSIRGVYPDPDFGGDFLNGVEPFAPGTAGQPRLGSIDLRRPGILSINITRKSAKPAAGTPPAPVVATPEPAGAVGQPKFGAWLGAEFENHAAGVPLEMDHSYLLAFFTSVGARSQPGLAEVALDEMALGSVLTIQTTSKDFTLNPPSQLLHIGQDGYSLGRARFDVKPLREGKGAIDAIVLKDGNFVQRLTLEAHTGADAEGPVLVIVASAGRPHTTQEKLKPRDLMLMLEEDNGGFNLTAVKTVTVRGRLNMSADELARRVGDVREVLLEIVNSRHDGRRPYLDEVVIPADLAAESLRKLAEKGFLLYRAIFFGAQADQQLKRIGTRLRDLSTTKALDLQIVSDRFIIPWPILYVAASFDPDDIRAERFLGFSNRIEQIPLQNGWDVLESEIKHDSNLQIGVNVNRRIDVDMSAPFVADQLDFFSRVEKSGRAKITVRDSDEQVQVALTDANTPDQLIYCFCHAAAPGDARSPDEALLRFENVGSLSLGDLRLAEPADAPSFKSNPLVFINACQSAQLSPLFYDGFVPYLLAKGARGVIGTECDTPATFAKLWATRFFQEFLEGRELGDVVLSLRQELLNDKGNLLGLLYAVYCDGDTRIDPALGLVGG